MSSAMSLGMSSRGQRVVSGVCVSILRKQDSGDDRQSVSSECPAHTHKHEVEGQRRAWTRRTAARDKQRHNRRNYHNLIAAPPCLTKTTVDASCSAVSRKEKGVNLCRWSGISHVVDESNQARVDNDIGVFSFKVVSYSRGMAHHISVVREHAFDHTHDAPERTLPTLPFSTPTGAEPHV